LAPETLKLSAAAFADAWHSLEASGVNLKDCQSNSARDILAKAIIAAVKLGERDQAQLREAALTSWALHNAHPPRQTD
jgi:hypothetical protein